jgi:hypothetical protein
VLNWFCVIYRYLYCHLKICEISKKHHKFFMCDSAIEIIWYDSKWKKTSFRIMCTWFAVTFALFLLFGVYTMLHFLGILLQVVVWYRNAYLIGGFFCFFIDLCLACEFYYPWLFVYPNKVLRDRFLRWFVVNVVIVVIIIIIIIIIL